MTRQRTGCSADPVAVGALSGHDRYDVVIYLLFLVGRGKEKFWVQLLHHLSIATLNLFSKSCLFPGKTSEEYSMNEIGYHHAS